MTFVLTVNGPNSVWVVADRRLSYAGRPPKDDACKVMFLEAENEVAILAYAGLGATAYGTEPAEWMSRVLRGRKLPLEQSLGVIAEAMKRKFPIHLARLAGLTVPAHSVVASAFVGNEPRVYSIDMALSPDHKSYAFRYTRHVIDPPVSAVRRTPPLALAGSGGIYLSKRPGWRRGLFGLVRANDRGQVSTRVVADYLAGLNWRVHQGLTDASVGPRCVVAWRHRRESRHRGGGGHQFYMGTTRDSDSPSLPTIAGGMDLHALSEVLMPYSFKTFEAMRRGQPAPDDKDAINAELALLPDQPDESLR